jgi:transposase
MPEYTPIETDDFLGVDLGEVNIAVDSTGKIFSNDKIRLKYQKTKKPLPKEKHEIK